VTALGGGGRIYGARVFGSVLVAFSGQSERRDVSPRSRQAPTGRLSAAWPVLVVPASPPVAHRPVAETRR
jgi:hypothetical protein